MVISATKFGLFVELAELLEMTATSWFHRHIGAGRVAARGAGIGCYEGIRDHHGQTASGSCHPSFCLMSARRMCFWTLPVAVMGRADAISRRSGSFCVASFCARR